MKEGKDKRMSAALPTYSFDAPNPTNAPMHTVNWLVHQFYARHTPAEMHGIKLKFVSEICIICRGKNIPAAQIIIGEDKENGGKYNFAAYICKKCDKNISGMADEGQSLVNSSLSKISQIIMARIKK